MLSFFEGVYFSKNYVSSFLVTEFGFALKKLVSSHYLLVLRYLSWLTNFQEMESASGEQMACKYIQWAESIDRINSPFLNEKERDLLLFTEVLFTEINLLRGTTKDITFSGLPSLSYMTKIILFKLFIFKGMVMIGQLEQWKTMCTSKFFCMTQRDV